MIVERVVKAVPVWIEPEALGAEGTSQNDDEECVGDAEKNSRV